MSEQLRELVLVEGWRVIERDGAWALLERDGHERIVRLDEGHAPAPRVAAVATWA